MTYMSFSTCLDVDDFFGNGKCLFKVINELIIILCIQGFFFFNQGILLTKHCGNPDYLMLLRHLVVSTGTYFTFMHNIKLYMSK